MALIRGNKTSANPIPNGNTFQFSHTQNTGSDGCLLFSIGQNNGQSVSAVTYNGVAMTQIMTRNLSGISTRLTYFKLENPPTGSNTLQVSFSAGVFNPVVYMALSFTGCGDIVNVNNTALQNSPNSASPVVAENSMLYVSGSSSYTISTITIDGVVSNSPNFDHDGSVNGKRFTGEVSTNLSAGARTGILDTGAPSFTVSNQMFEILEATGGGGGKAEGSWFQML